MITIAATDLIPTMAKTSISAKMIGQLRSILQLTRTEASIARTRQSQARTDAVRRELAENALNSDARALHISEQLKALGGVPDVVAPAVGRLTALAKTVVEQAQPVAEALLGDLALEHELLDRSRYLRVLATASEERQVVRLADRLIEAHEATVDWLTTVLAEEALGGPAALQPTPVQAVAGVATRIANLPARWSGEQVNRTVDRLQKGGRQVREEINEVSGRASQLRNAVVETVMAGRNAALGRAEQVARRDGARETAEGLHATRAKAGALTEAELPIKNYDQMAQSRAIAAIRKLTETEDVRVLIDYEQANKGRSSVISAAQTRFAALAKDVAGIS
jgi:bacterioferritin (cytochrome b1)